MNMTGVQVALRRLNARSFANAALPPQQKSSTTVTSVAATSASASTITRATSAAVPNAGTIARKKKQSKDSRFATVGLPLLLFVAGGYVALTQFVGGKFEARDHIIKSHTTREFDLEEEHKKMTKKLVLDDFEIKPVPKPGESTK